MRILFLGDVMGRAGREAVQQYLPELRQRYSFDFVIVNGENASHGRGITEKHYREILDAGADVVTLGDHAFDQRETLGVIAREEKLLRPINMSDTAPGRGAMMYETNKGQRVLVINALGRVFMNPIDDPFAAVDDALNSCPLGDVADAAIVDFHAEATSEMQGMGHFCDGRASLVVGTHTHIPTADHRILKGGTALMSDAGMCGDYDSVIGMQADEPVHRFVTGMTKDRFTPAEGPPSICGVAIETGADGLCTYVAPLRVGGSISQALPWQ